jgi:UPF0755 protein
VTTDIKSRLSDLGKQWKEKLNGKQAAEEAQEASPAETAAIGSGEPETEIKPGAAAVEEEQPEEVAETESAQPEEKPAGTGETADSETGDQKEQGEPPGEDEPDGGRITDEALAEVLLAFGWRVPDGGDRPGSFPSQSGVPGLDDMAAEVTAAMKEFALDEINIYEEDASGQAAEETGTPQTEPVPQTTAVFPTIGAAEEPAQPEEIGEAEKPAEEMPEQASEENAGEEAPIDGRELFSGMNQEILKEVFSEEELNALEGDDTHVFKKEELEDLGDKQKEAEKKPEKEAPERRRTRRAERKPAEEKPKKQREPAKPAEPTFTARDYRPIRRKRSYRTGLRGGLMYFGFVVCVSVILASVGWLAADDVLSLNKDYVEAEVYVGEKLDMKQVSTELYNKGLIKYPRLFRIFAKLMKAETKMDPGVYSLSSKLDYNAMVHAMHQSDDSFEERATVKVTIPEGKTLKQTFQILAEHGVCPYETLLECAANYEFKYEFLTELPYGEENRLEGYLFPDTYEFFAPSDPEEAIRKFLDNFNSKVSLDMRQTAADMGYSLHEIITIASLVEMEAGKDTERATIASVIYNRLNSSYYPYLQIDATIQYALEERKESLTNADLEIDSPYNTYKYTGLPPGPIANPGLASIRAALAPESTGYYFYALNKSGSHNFFATMDQFNYFVNSSEFGG